MQQQTTDQFLELTKYLSLQLQIDLPNAITQILTQDSNKQQINILSTQIVQFGYQCLNHIMYRLYSDKWQQVLMNNDQQLELSEGVLVQRWRQFISLVEQCFIQQDEQESQPNLSDKTDIMIQDAIQIFGILCHGCQAARKNIQILMDNQKINHELALDSKQKLRPKTSQPPSGVTKQQKKIKKINTRKKLDSATVQNKKISTSNQILNNNKRSICKNKNANIDNKNGNRNMNMNNEIEKQIIQTITQTIKQTKKPMNITAGCDKQASSAVQGAKRRFDYTLKNTHKQNKSKAANIKAKKDIVNPSGTAVDQNYMKYIANKHKKLNQQVQSQQLKYYVQLRDKKIAYIKHIHKLIQQLQRQRLVQSNKQQRQQQQNQKKQLQCKVAQVQQLFSNNIEMLKSNYKVKRQNRAIHNVQEIKVCRQIEDSVKEKKRKQMEHMKDLWAAQCQKLQLITGDEQKMKNKLIQIYRKNRPI